MLLSVFMLALHSIVRNMLRSFLTILGIVIGVSAVITMVTLGNGATQAIKTQISGLGTNLLMVSPGQRSPGGGGGGGGGGVPQFTEADALAIQSQIGGVASVAPQGRASATVIANGRNWATSVIGSTNAWFDTGNWKLASGRIFADDEQLAGGLHHRRDGAARDFRRHGRQHGSWRASAHPPVHLRRGGHPRVQRTGRHG
jgi:putative ABC transport system permease protein